MVGDKLKQFLVYFLLILQTFSWHFWVLSCVTHLPLDDLNENSETQKNLISFKYL